MLKLKHCAIASAMFLFGCASQQVATVGALTTALSATPAGQTALAQLNSLQANVASVVQKANSSVGLTPADVAAICAFDSAVHPVINIAAGVVSGGTVIDSAAYTAAQTACSLEAGQVPSAAQIAPLIQEATQVLGAL